MELLETTRTIPKNKQDDLFYVHFFFVRFQFSVFDRLNQTVNASKQAIILLQGNWNTTEMRFIVIMTSKRSKFFIEVLQRVLLLLNNFNKKTPLRLPNSVHLLEFSNGKIKQTKNISTSSVSSFAANVSFMKHSEITQNKTSQQITYADVICHKLYHKCQVDIS